MGREGQMMGMGGAGGHFRAGGSCWMCESGDWDSWKRVLFIMQTYASWCPLSSQDPGTGGCSNLLNKTSRTRGCFLRSLQRGKMGASFHSSLTNERPFSSCQSLINWWAIESGNKGTWGGRDREAERERINTTGADIVIAICYNV